MKQIKYFFQYIVITFLFIIFRILGLKYSSILSGHILKIFGRSVDNNSDNFVCLLSDNFEGNIDKPLPVNFDSFRLVSFGGSREVKFSVNTDMGVITCNFEKGETQLIYIISALIN